MSGNAPGSSESLSVFGVWPDSWLGAWLGDARCSRLTTGSSVMTCSAMPMLASR